MPSESAQSDQIADLIKKLIITHKCQSSTEVQQKEMYYKTLFAMQLKVAPYIIPVP